jgi:Tol biopolymer transport system component
MGAIVLLVAGCAISVVEPTSAPRSPSPALPPSATVSIAPPSVAASRLASATDPVDLGEVSGRIAFAFDDGIWTSRADGTHRQRITSDGGFDPSWSPDGRRIVYRRLTADDDGELWTVEADGSQRADLGIGPSSDWGPSFSPDGTMIAFSSNKGGPLAIWVMHSDGSAARQVTAGHGEYPSWSPDGKRLAYAGGSYYDIHVVDLDGSNDRAITDTPAYDMGPAWSPDGRTIVYHTQVDAFPNVGESGQGPEMELHAVGIDGSNDRRLTDDSVEDSFAAWSPDGRFLVWARHGELVVGHPDGSGMASIGSGNFPDWVADR